MAQLCKTSLLSGLHCYFGGLETYAKTFRPFQQIVTKPYAYDAIRAITHSQPLLVFWVTPEREVLDAREAHHDNPPHGDRSVLAHRTHKRHLRGRAAFIGNRLYIVIYGDEPEKRWSKRQCKHVVQALPALYEALAAQGIDPVAVERAKIIDEYGREMV